MYLATAAFVLTTALSVAAGPFPYGRGVAHSRAQASTITSKFGPVIDVGYAAFIGNGTNPNIHFYGAIPYVKPPIGDLRWRAPIKLDETVIDGSSKPIHDARGFGQICVQQPAVIGVGGEDCVTLNVWKPANATSSSKLPVVIYIHGGGNYYNSAQGFPMSDWVNITNGQLVAVNIQYRLGLFGYLASALLMSNGSANVGLKDQRAALEWVQRHISAFGGDPTRVTISGQSSGAGSVLSHMIWKGGEANPPFSAAILQSIGNDPFPLNSTYEQCFGNVTTFTGCADADNVMSCLRSTPLTVLVQAINHRPQPLCKYLPIIDGDVIRGIPSQEITAGHFSKVPVIAGHTTNDGTTFAGSPTVVVNASTLYTSITSARYTHLTNATFYRALALYNQSHFSSFYDLAQTLTGETQFTCYDWYIANKTAEAGLASYNYRWNTPDPVQLALNPYKGVLHTSELYFLFDGTNSGVSASMAQNNFVPFNATERPLANEAVSYWTSFARSHDPSTYKFSTSPTWPSLGNGTAKRIVPQEGNSTTMTASLLEDVPADYIQRCLFWVSVANETRV